MSDPLRITCPCGYENWVPEEKRGQEFMCPMCGQELIAEDSEAAPVPQSDPSDKSDKSDRSTKSTPSIERPRNPFEADELETAVRPKFEYAPPPATPAAPPKPRARSPFEVDAEPEAPAAPERGKLVAGPFSLELTPAPKPAPAPIDQLEKHRPKASRPRHTFIDTISPHDAPTGEKCSQCGRELRGTWDRIETASGLMCYVCSNQATHGVPERLKAAPAVERREVRESDLITGPSKYSPPVEEAPFAIDTHSDGFKKAISLIAVLCLVAAFIVWITGWGSPDPNALQQSQEVAAKEVQVPDFVKYILWAGRVVGALLTPFIAIYLTLDRDNHLPYDSFKRNIQYLTAVIGLLTGVAIGVYIAMAAFEGIFIAGRIWMMAAGMIFMFIQISILSNMLDFRIRDFFWLYFFYLPITGAMLAIVGMFLKWGLYALVAV